MIEFIIIALIITGLVAIIKLHTKAELKGSFLKSPLSLYYKRINDIILPYNGLKCIESLLWSAQKILQNVLNEYNSYIKYNNLEVGSIYQILIEEYDNRIIVEAFALIYIFTYKFRNEFSISPSEEEKNALISLREYCREKLILLKNDIPDCFWNEFELDPKTLERKAYWF